MTDRPPTEIEIVCLHYLSPDDDERRREEEYGKDSRWKCPRCGKLSFWIRARQGTAGCGWECAIPDGLGVPGVIAYLGGYHPRTQQREINRERRRIVQEERAERQRRQQEQQEWDHAIEEMEVREYEREYTIEERRAALEMLRKDRAGVLLSPQLYEAAAARSVRAGSRVLNAYTAITEDEAKLAALWFVGALLVVFYGVGYLESFASYVPLDAAFYVPREEWGPLAPSRERVGEVLPEWVVSCRLLLGIALGAACGGIAWKTKSSARRSRYRLGEKEYVGIHDYDRWGKARWRDSGG